MEEQKQGVVRKRGRVKFRMESRREKQTLSGRRDEFMLMVLEGLRWQPTKNM